MVQLLYKNIALEFEPGAKFQLNLACPIFDPNRIARTFSYPFRLPKTPRNESALGHLSRYDRRDRSGVLDGARLHLGGSFWAEGELALTGNNLKYFEVVFRSKEIPWLNKLGEVRINEILDKEVVPKIASATFKMVDPPDAYLWSIVINGVIYGNYIFGSFPIGTNIYDIIPAGVAALINADHPGLVEVVPVTGAAPLLKFYLYKFPEHEITGLFGFEGFPYRTVASCRQENFISYAVNYLADPSEKLSFPVIHWRDFYGDKNPAWQFWFNALGDGEIRTLNTPWSTSSWQTSWLPAIRHKYILESIRQELKIAAISGVLDDPEMQELVLISNYSIDEPLFEKQDYGDVDRQYMNGFKNDFDLNQHVPSVTAEVYLNAFSELFRLFFELRGNVLWIRACRELIEKPPVDWGDYIDPKTISEKIPELKGFVLKFPANKNDQEQTNQRDPFVSNPAKAEYITKADIFHIGAGSNTWNKGEFKDLIVPIKWEKGVNSAASSPSNSQIYWMWDKGLRTFDEIVYNFATNHNAAPDGTQNGDYSLRWNGPDGLYRKWHRGIAELDDSPTISAIVILPIVELMKFRIWDNARVRFFTPKGDIICVIKKITANFEVDSQSSYVPCEVELVIQ